MAITDMPVAINRRTGYKGHARLTGYALSIICLATIVLTARGVWASGDPLASRQPFGVTRVAVTIDDIPDHGDLPAGVSRMDIATGLIAILRSNGIDHSYAFANGTFRDYHPQEIAILKKWLAAGFSLGNHSYHHLDLTEVTASAYIADIAKEDRLLATFRESSSSLRDRRVFRYPYLDEGDTLKKRNTVRTYLAQNSYRIAEVTMDYNDWAWNDAYFRCLAQHDGASVEWLKSHLIENADRHLRGANAISEMLFKRRIPQILLLHDGAFDLLTLDMVLKHWRGQGVKFVSLDEALADPVYNINPNFAYDGSFDFLKQIAESRHVDISDLYDSIYTVHNLGRICNGTSH